MALKVAKQGVDIGIVVTDSANALAFYRDTLGIPLEETREIANGGIMHRMRCGNSLIKLLGYKQPPKHRAPGGTLTSATGFRYITITVTNLNEALAACRAKGYTIPHEPYDNHKGLIVGAVNDPDGNQVEIVQDSATWRKP